MHDNGRGCVVQAYNAQLAVDAESQVIIAAEVTQQVLDRTQLFEMMKSAERNAGCRPEVITADAGYWDTETLRQAIETGARILVPPDGAMVTQGSGQPRQMTRSLTA